MITTLAMTDIDGTSSLTSRRRPKVGIYLPNWTGGLEGGRAPRWPELRSLVQLIEDVGFDAMWVADEFRYVLDVVLEPRGPRADGPPMVIGTISIGPRLMRCVARFADGWNGWLAFGDNRPAAVRPHREALDAACREVGREPASLRRTVGIAVAMSDAPFGFGPFDLSANRGARHAGGGGGHAWRLRR
jgi:alkanesulfonate monooxygenase SsuD/methylene tetrahydromethanopterin reductase-like flavin-dependent oxidoreductase (luciferase family)